MTGRETTEQKALRYLAERRLTVEVVHEDDLSGLVIAATCRGGDDTVYDLGFEAGEWWCRCPARVRCAHLLALQMVTRPPEAS